MKKYEFTGESSVQSIPAGVEARAEVTVHRIRAVVDIPEHHIKKGELGGWIETEENLSHEGTCWLANGVICGRSTVTGDVLIGTPEADETACIIRGSSHIEGTGDFNDVVIDNSILKGHISSFGTSFDMSYVEGKVTACQGLIQLCQVQSNGGKIVLFDCVLEPKQARLKITNHPGEQLTLDNVRVNFDEGTGDQTIHAFGEVRHLFCDSLKELELNGQVDIEHVYLDEHTSLRVPSESQTVKIRGKSSSQPIHLVEGIKEIVDTTLVGAVTLKGNLRLTESLLSDFAEVENRSADVLLLENIEMYDCSKIERKAKSDQHVKDTLLTTDEKLVLR